MRNINELSKLFREKRFSEIIFLIESDSDEKSSEILNILAISRLSLERSKNSFELALREFKEAYLKEKKTQNGLNAAINYLNASAELYDYLDHHDTSDYSKVFFEQAIIFFKEAQLNFEFNPKLISAGIRIFKRLNYLEIVFDYYKKLYEKDNLNLQTLSSWIFLNNYYNEWKQSDYYIFTQLLEKYIPEISNEKLKPISTVKNKKIKIGFLSSDINKYHSITFFFKTVCLLYDRNTFEIYIFSNHRIEDEGFINFKKLVDRTFNISKLNDIEAINFIRSHNIDIMFDLMGLSSSNRISLFKHRLAPAQVSWLGYCNTLGIKNMDYLIADPYLIHENELNQYSEKVIFLPSIWNCHCGFDFPRKELPSPFLKNNYITFGSFNNFNKINASVVKVWSRILKKIPNSKLVIKSPTKKNVDYFKDLFAQNSILERIFFLSPEKEFKNHLFSYSKIDIALDTFPYNGVTTSFEAIWMGVPVVTMMGSNFNSRCGVSINSNIGMKELISLNENDYVNKAYNLATDKKTLISIRKKIYENAIESPLFNKKKFSHEFFNLIKKL